MGIRLLAQILTEIARGNWIRPVSVRHGVVIAVIANLALDIRWEGHEEEQTDASR
jgi:hypothetical protein